RQTTNIPRQLSQKSLPNVVRAQVSGGSAEEVDDEPDRGGHTETGNPEACDQTGRGEELHDREHPPPVAGESDAVEAGGNGPGRPEGQQPIAEDDDGEDDEGPDGIGEDGHSRLLTRVWTAMTSSRESVASVSVIVFAAHRKRMPR